MALLSRRPQIRPETTADAIQPRVQITLQLPSVFSAPARRMDAMQRHPRIVFKVFIVCGVKWFVLVPPIGVTLSGIDSIRNINTDFHRALSLSGI